MNEDGPILIGLSVHLSKGALYIGLGATPGPCDKVHRCAVNEFYSGGTISDGLTIDKSSRRYARAIDDTPR